MLTKIKISNFKSIGDEELVLSPLTILTGMNSSGKSSVIQSVMLALMHGSEGNYFSMATLLRYADDFKSIRNKRTNAKKVKITLDKDDGRTTYLELNDDESVLCYGGDDYYYDQPKNKDKPELLYLNANRLGAQDIVALSNRRVGDIGENIFSTFDKIKNELTYESLIKFEASKTISYQVAEWLSYITGVTSELKTERIGDQVKVFFSIRDLEGDVSPFNLGAGMSYISKVIIICLMAKKGDLVILENPEVQLHPKAQSHLGEFLSFISNGGVQLIVETHCEHLLNKISYQIYEGHFPSGSAIIHYKENVEKEFKTLIMNDSGGYEDKLGNSISFPSGFFDATLDEILSMR